MTDLEKMLATIEDVDIGPRRIHGLYYIDDIVLFSANEDHLLNNMFSIADSFAK